MLEPRATSCGPRSLSLLFVLTLPFLFATSALAQNVPNNRKSANAA